MANSIEIRWQNIFLFLAFIFLLLLSVLIFQPQIISVAELSKAPDQCLSCHSDVQDMSPAHPVKTFGCAVCHLGNPLSTAKTNAHAGMVRNPSDLLWADKTCGQSNCHPTLVKDVRTSIMTSNSGLVSATLFQWQESGVLNDSLTHIHNTVPDTSLATDHLRKLCAGCHINKIENDFAGEIGQRGGGCNDCHLQRNKENPEAHPAFTVEMGIDVCEKCHNRSNRTALNYQGKFESEGYGTPYENGTLSSDTLSGGRFFYHIPADAHFKAGMVCIDCHTAGEVMGDGKRHAHLEDQVQVRCADCHQAKFNKPDSANITWKVIGVNLHLNIPEDSLLVVTSGDSFFSNIIRENGKIILTGKTDGKKHLVEQTNARRECILPGHERLSCQACHTGYTPQCYGCHDVYDPNGKQMDKITYEETPGHWKEFRSYLRFERPSLGLDQFNRIVPMAPGCQVYLTELDTKGEVKNSAFWPTMAGFDPHNTRRETPACLECHSDPKRLGLGEGNLILKDGRLMFKTPYDAESSGLGQFALDQMTATDGKRLQKMSRVAERPFNQQEIEKIYAVSYCLLCHDQAADKIFNNFSSSLKRFNNERGLRCSGK